MNLQKLHLMLNSLTIYRSILNNGLVVCLDNLIISNNIDDFIKYYSKVYFTLAQSHSEFSLKNYIADLIIYDNNPFTKGLSHAEDGIEHNTLLNAVARDLKILEQISEINSYDVKCCAMQNFNIGEDFGDVVNELPSWTNNLNEKYSNILGCISWDSNLTNIELFHKTNGFSIFAEFSSFIYRQDAGDNFLCGIKDNDPVRFSDFVGYEYERSIVINNTMQLLSGRRANNVLLYGDRGTGKSATIKALVNEYDSRGMRIIELPQQNLCDLNKIINKIKDINLKFIIFVDDLTFETNDSGYASLKAVLEGGLQTRPANVVIYATSNRRHLIKESFSEREASDDVHRQDTLQEKLSLADRFGITVTFSSPNQAAFLNIVYALAKSNNLNFNEDYLKSEALKWVMSNNARSPRTAQQFINWLSGRI